MTLDIRRSFKNARFLTLPNIVEKVRLTIFSLYLCLSSVRTLTHVNIIGFPGKHILIEAYYELCSVKTLM